jgi:hypothetical protein
MAVSKTTRRKADTTTGTAPQATGSTPQAADSATPDAPATPTTPDPQPGAPATPATPNLQVMMVAAVLDAYPDGLTGASIVTASGLQPGVVGKVLAAMEATGTARRIPPADPAGVESWARGENADLSTVDPGRAPTHTVCPACQHRRPIVVNVGGARRNGTSNTTPGVNGDGAAKFRKNELYGLVRDFITTQPGHVFTYGDIARELSQRHGRDISSGAVRNNVDRLLAEGVAVRANPTDPHDTKVTAASKPDAHSPAAG